MEVIIKRNRMSVGNTNFNPNPDPIAGSNPLPGNTGDTSSPLAPPVAESPVHAVPQFGNELPPMTDTKVTDNKPIGKAPKKSGGMFTLVLVLFMVLAILAAAGMGYLWVQANTEVTKLKSDLALAQGMVDNLQKQIDDLKKEETPTPTVGYDVATVCPVSFPKTTGFTLTEKNNNNEGYLTFTSGSTANYSYTEAGVTGPLGVIEVNCVTSSSATAEAAMTAFKATLATMSTTLVQANETPFSVTGETPAQKWNKSVISFQVAGGILPDDSMHYIFVHNGKTILVRNILNKQLTSSMDAAKLSELKGKLNTVLDTMKFE